MEIRALTGFNEDTRKQYGRQYTPLNGTTKTLLGSPGIGYLPPKDVDFGVPTDIILPTSMPPQKIEMIDPADGKKKLITVDNINKLTELIKQGFDLYGQIKGGSGKKVVVVKRKIPAPTTSGFETKTLIGFGVAAAIMISLYMSLNKK